MARRPTLQELFHNSCWLRSTITAFFYHIKKQVWELPTSAFLRSNIHYPTDRMNNRSYRHLRNGSYRPRPSLPYTHSIHSLHRTDNCCKYHNCSSQHLIHLITDVILVKSSVHFAIYESNFASDFIFQILKRFFCRLFLQLIHTENTCPEFFT